MSLRIAAERAIFLIPTRRARVFRAKRAAVVALGFPRSSCPRRHRRCRTSVGWQPQPLWPARTHTHTHTNNTQHGRRDMKEHAHRPVLVDQAGKQLYGHTNIASVFQEGRRHLERRLLLVPDAPAPLPRPSEGGVARIVARQHHRGAHRRQAPICGCETANRRMSRVSPPIGRCTPRVRSGRRTAARARGRIQANKQGQHGVCGLSASFRGVCDAVWINVRRRRARDTGGGEICLSSELEHFTIANKKRRKSCTT